MGSWRLACRVLALVLLAPLSATGQTGSQAPVGHGFRDCADCPEMVVIPPGTAGVGARASDPVTLRDPLAVGRYHVTVAEYRAFVQETGERDGGWRTRFPTQSPRNPVIRVSWDDAQAYVRWLARKTGRRYRLLSEAEWEYAARAGTTTAYFWGDAVGRAKANCDGCGSAWDKLAPSPVGSFAPNGFGLYDMAGNAWQWVEDCWSETFPAAADAAAVVRRADCDRRVLKGGSWVSVPHLIRSANRTNYAPGSRFSHFGFRVARDLAD